MGEVGADEQTLYDRAQEFTQILRQVTGTLEGFQHERAEIFDGGIWSGGAANAANGKAGEIINELTGLQSDLVKAITWYKNVGDNVAQTKTTIAERVDQALQQISDLENDSTGDAEDRANAIASLVSKVRGGNVFDVSAAASKVPAAGICKPPRGSSVPSGCNRAAFIQGLRSESLGGFCMSWPPPGSSQPPRSSIPPLGAQGQQPQGQSYVGPPGLQHPWYPPPGPPRGGGLKWVILGVVALGAVIAVAVAVTVVVLHSNSGGGSKDSTASSSGPASGIASANDKGPVAVITEDPTCTAWTSIQTAIADRERNGWDKRDPSIPATAWTAEQRAQYEAVGRAMRNAADQTVALVKRTPHRVMRELYEQSIAYWRAYADHIANYSPRDENLAHTASNASSGVGAICTAVTNGSAVEWGSQVASAAPPSRLTPPGDPANPQRFLTSSNPVCGEWDTTLAQLDADTTEWRGIDGNIPASQWSPEQAKINRDMAPVMSRAAGKLEQLGVRSGNPTLEDFAVLSAQYRRALVQSLPSYIAADNQLSEAANYLESTVLSACQAVGG